MRNVHNASLLLAAAAGLVAPAAAFGQASFHENFEDIGPTSYSVPSVLTQRGWIIRNQSQPLGSRSWFSGVVPEINEIYFSAQQGDRYLAADQGSTSTSGGGSISAWAILPPVPNQQAGDRVTFWARSLGGAPSLQVRYSPSGATGTGTTAQHVGDFGTVLLSVPQVSGAGWTRYETTVPGNGRIALRYHGYFAGVGSYNPYIGIDNLSVGTPPPPPCNLPPIPSPGQTVTWTAAAGPYEVCENVSIPEGGTVNVEPGAVINFSPQKQIAIAGTLNVNGTLAQPVQFVGSSVWPHPLVIYGGTVNATAAHFDRFVSITAPYAEVHLADCVFTSQNAGFEAEPGIGIQNGAFIHLNRTTFNDTYCFTEHCVTVLENCTFNNTQNGFWYGVTDFRGNNTFTGRPLSVLRHRGYQPMHITNVTATNVVDDAGIAVAREHALIGPNVTLSNNLFPVRTDNELMRGSQIPLTGNFNNAIDTGIGVFTKPSVLHNFGIPWRLTVPNNPIEPEFGTDIVVDPGVTVEHEAGTFLVGKYSHLQLMGTHDAPIRIVPTSPGVPHLGPWWGGAHAPHVEYVIAEGMVDGFTANSTQEIKIENSTFRDNNYGIQLWTGSWGYVGKSLFQNNGTGVAGEVDLFRPSMPNNNSAFENNGIAVDGPDGGQVNDNHVWWNSPSGPRHPQNPSGTGELIGGDAVGVSIFPFLTQRPNFENRPPQVRANLAPGMQPNQSPYSANQIPYLKPGTKYILHWQASDDDQIVSQKVVLWLDGFAGSQSVIADNLPGNQRSLEFTIPNVGYRFLTPHHFQIFATDTVGQVGWDRCIISIPHQPSPASVTINDEAYRGRTFIPGEIWPLLTASVNGGSPTNQADFRIVLESDYDNIGASFAGQFFEPVPSISTDRARIAIFSAGNANEYQWHYSPHYFSIRHEPRLGWQSPVVQMTSPTQGQQFPGGSIIPITWTVSAQQGLYGFDIQVSYDGGNVWHALVYNLDASARNYNWQLPPSTGIADLRIRVIAKDRKFQNSASGDDRTFAVTPGGGAGTCYANCDGSTAAPILNVADFTCFLQRYAAGNAYANCDQSTTQPTLNVADFTCFLQRYAAGCP